MKTSLLLLLCYFIATYAFSTSRIASFQQKLSRQWLSPLATQSCKRDRFALRGKADLFSDDLFDDEDDMPVQKESKNMPKKKYLEEEWDLDAEDKKEFKGFPTNEKPVASDTPAADEPVKNYPAFALLYKFRREYFDSDVDSMMADHKGYCQKFKRLLNSEELRLNKSKGVVLLWAGFTEDDKEETRAEVMRFVEDDPLIAKDAIEMWDIVDLQVSEEDAGSSDKVFKPAGSAEPATPAA